ncbi:MAG: glutathione S-transferase family protein [Pseudomonadota bacterium]
MKLYTFPLSPNCRRVQLVAATLGTSFDEEEVIDISTGAQKSPEYLALNPNGLVPTLVDGDLKIWESRGIIEYLAAKNPGQGLQGASETERADIGRWLCWDAGHLAPEVFTLVFENMIKVLLNLGAADQAKCEAASEQLSRFLGVLDTCLAGKTYLVGDKLTLADLSIASTLTYHAELGMPIASHPNLNAWFGRIAASDAWVGTQPKLPEMAA